MSGTKGEIWVYKETPGDYDYDVTVLWGLKYSLTGPTLSADKQSQRELSAPKESPVTGSAMY